MTVEGMEKLILSKSVNRTEVKDTELIEERIFTAMKKIAYETTPQVLMVEDKTGIEVIRKLSDKLYIKSPEIPVKGNGRNLEIDNELLDAVAYYVIAGLEPRRASINLAMFYDGIANYEQQMFEASEELEGIRNIRNERFI